MPDGELDRGGVGVLVTVWVAGTLRVRLRDGGTLRVTDLEKLRDVV